MSRQASSNFCTVKAMDKTTTQHNRPEMVPIDQAAEELGRSRRTLDRWRESGILPAKRFGGRVVVLRTDLDKMLNNLPPA